MKRHAAIALCLGIGACTASSPEPDSALEPEDVGEAQQADSLADPSEPNVIRFLEQATFGPRLANGVSPLPLDSIERVSDVGITQSITDLLAAPSVAFDGSPTSQALDAQFFVRAVDGTDQLRQRVAFALSQIIVVGSGGIPTVKAGACTVNTVVQEHCKQKQAMAVYLNTLQTHALGNYKDLLVAITKSAVMGQYLDMVNNRAFTTGGVATEPNENYARELLQLFTVGLYQLNDDGTRKLDANGKTIPAYTQDQVESFAHALTGWTYAKVGGTHVAADCPTVGKNNGTTNYLGTAPNNIGEMLPCDVNHDKSERALFCVDHDGNAATPKVCQKTTANAGAVQHLNEAIENVFRHDSLPPYICKQLIQHLVTSNPSPAYVARVVAKFKNDGSNSATKRGNMQAVVRAILEDSEARFMQVPLSQYATFGHLRSPALQVTNVVRWLDGHMDLTNGKNPGSKLAGASASMGQPITKSPSVFSFYPPETPLPGNPTLLAPEFGIFNASTAAARGNVLYDMLFTTAYTSAGVALDLTVLPADPNELVLWFAQYPLHSAMSADSQLAIYDAITQPGTWTTTTDRRKKGAAMLAFMSPEFSIQR